MFIYLIVGILIGATVATAALLKPIGKPSSSISNLESQQEEIHVLRKKLKFVMDLNLVHEGVDPRTMRPLLMEKREAIRQLVRMECNNIDGGDWNLH